MLVKHLVVCDGRAWNAVWSEKKLRTGSETAAVGVVQDR